MNVISLLALAVAVLLSCTTRINVGLLAIALAWLIGVYGGGMTVGEVLAGFPSQLFLTLVGVTFLFTQAQVNGTLDRVAARAVGLCRGNVGTIPLMFFALALGLAFIGPGSIASAALIAPTAMAVARTAGISSFLMAIMVANGSSAASLSPFGPTGIVVNELMLKMGLANVEWRNFLTVAVAHSVVGIGGYFAFGGWRYFRRSADRKAIEYAATRRPMSLGEVSASRGEVPEDLPQSAQPFEMAHWLTLGVIAALITSVLVFNVNVGMGALAGAVLLVLVRAADETASIRAMPWAPILMVSGVTVMVAMVEKTGGLDLFSTLLARFSTENGVHGLAAFVTGVISLYSSTAGVVLPAFLPTVPGVIEELGGGDLRSLASSMIIGAHLVDVSPLSTTGALCIAAAPARDVPQMFRWMLAWGVSMTVVAAVGCYLVFGVF